MFLDEKMLANHKVVAIIQARMTSSRLPKKVMKIIAGKPMLGHVINRVTSSQIVDEVLIATTTDETDDEIEKFCKLHNYSCFRGHPFDVLDRYYQAAKRCKADVIVRITGDCPLMDSSLIDTLLEDFIDSKVDFAANRLPPPWKRTYPIGLDIEIVRFQALEKAWKEANSQFEREHVMPYLYDLPGRFKILLKHHDPDYGIKRWTVDTPQDLEFVKRIFDHFSPRLDFSWKEVIQFLEANPELEQINVSINAKLVDDVDNRYVDRNKAQ